MPSLLRETSLSGDLLRMKMFLSLINAVHLPSGDAVDAAFAPFAAAACSPSKRRDFFCRCDLFDAWSHLIREEVAFPYLIRRTEENGFFAFNEFNDIKRQLVAAILDPGSFRKSLRQFLMIECRLPLPCSTFPTMNSLALLLRSLRYQKRLLPANQWGMIRSL